MPDDIDHVLDDIDRVLKGLVRPAIFGECVPLTVHEGTSAVVTQTSVSSNAYESQRPDGDQAGRVTAVPWYTSRTTPSAPSSTRT